MPASLLLLYRQSGFLIGCEIVGLRDLDGVYEVEVVITYLEM